MALERFGEKFPQVDASAFVHPAAVVIGNVAIGPESSVWPGAVLRGDAGEITVGARTSIQDNVVVHAGPDIGTQIGDDCIVGHLAFLEDAWVEDLCLIGVGSRILNAVRMRRGSVAAAGAVVLGGQEVPSGSRAQGVPARIVEAAGWGIEEIRAGAKGYVDSARRMAESVTAPERVRLSN